MWRRIGSTCMCVRREKPLPSRATAKALMSWCPGCASWTWRWSCSKRRAASRRRWRGRSVQPACRWRWRTPRQVRDFARATGTLAKTDALDAAVIAHFAAAIRPEPRPVPDAQARALGDLVTRRRQIVEMMTVERGRRKRLTNRRMIKSIDRLLKALQRELSDLEEDLDDAIRGTPAWRETEDLLKSVPGIGNVTAHTLIADLPELGTLGRKKIAAPGRRRPLQPRQRHAQGQAHHLGRPCQGPRHALHGRPRRKPPQPDPKALLPTSGPGREAPRRSRSPPSCESC